MCLLQCAMAWWVRDMAWWKVLLAAYAISGTANQNLFTAQHELSHFLAFRKPLYNKLLSLASNCPLVIPTATKFRAYHQEHHSHLVSYSAMCFHCCGMMLPRSAYRQAWAFHCRAGCLNIL